MSRYVGLSICAIALAVACGTHPTTPTETQRQTPPPPPLTLTALKISGPSTVAPGESAQFTATGVMSDQSTQDYTSKVTWSSYNQLLTITPAGVATGHAVGDVNLQARFGLLFASVNVIVLPAGTYRLTGTVTESGLSVWGAHATVIAGTGTGLTSFTGEDGTYRLYGVAGSVQVQVTDNGYVPLTKTAIVTKHDVLDFPEFTQVNAAPSLNGEYRLTIEASDDCAQAAPGYAPLPREDWLRTYTATITQNGPGLHVVLGGANFLKRGQYGNYFEGRFEPQGLSFLLGDPYFYYLATGPDVTEIIAPDRVLSIDGNVLTTFASGTIHSLMYGFVNEWRLVNGSQIGAQLVSCRSARHLFTLTPLTGPARHRRQP